MFSSCYYFQIFSPIIKMMLTHQSTVDAVACLFAILLLVQPLNWIPGVYILDTLICHLWNGQFIYWYSVFISGELRLVFLLLFSCVQEAEISYLDLQKRMRLIIFHFTLDDWFTHINIPTSDVHAWKYFHF